MLQATGLSESAVAVLRFEIKGWRHRVEGRRLAEYRELAAAGIMEVVPGSDGDSEAHYRFSGEGLEHREEILRTEEERIQRERYAPPDRDISGAARALLRRLASGERMEVDEENRAAFRELAAARIVILGHSLTKGDESVYKFTYWGYRLRFEIAQVGCVTGAV